MALCARAGNDRYRQAFQQAVLPLLASSCPTPSVPGVDPFETVATDRYSAAKFSVIAPAPRRDARDVGKRPDAYD
jgi:hypothetical protein